MLVSVNLCVFCLACLSAVANGEHKSSVLIRKIDLQCKDNDRSCHRWATRTPSECLKNPGYMWKNCKKSCNKCAPCVNYNDQCDPRAKRNPSECEVNPDYMLVVCRKACGVCGKFPACVDQSSLCRRWANEGKCKTKPKYMYPRCTKSCKACLDEVCCVDHHMYCSDWAARGECESNPLYMLYKCEKSCNVCGARVGCFNPSSFAFEVTSSSDLMTPNFCKGYCAGRHKYAALTNGNTCLCGFGYNEFGTDPMLDDYFCQVPCAGNRSKTCGGKTKVEVYNV